MVGLKWESYFRLFLVDRRGGYRLESYSLWLAGLSRLLCNLGRRVGGWECESEVLMRW